jgi:hypothetical protein
MPMANPRRDPSEESIRIQEHTGGFRPREMMGDYDVNPNEDSDGLSHHNRQSTASEEMREQIDPERRKKKALLEMAGELPHISIQPEEMAESINNTPMMAQESELHESAMGVDMGHASNGIGISQGANVGPVRREGPGLIFSRSNEAFEDAWSMLKDDPYERVRQRAIESAAQDIDEMNQEEPGWLAQGFVGGLAGHATNTETGEEAAVGLKLHEIIDAQDIRAYQAENDGALPDQDWFYEVLQDKIKNDPMSNEAPYGVEDLTPLVHTPAHDMAARGAAYPIDDARYNDDPSMYENILHGSVGEFGYNPEESEKWQEANKSDMPPTLFLSDIVKGKRKKRGRKYEEDEESEEDEKKSKKKRKRKRKREMKRGKKEASRDIKGKTKRREKNIEQNISRHPKEQAFSPRRMLGANPRSSGIPLRIRDPVAYQRKLAAEKFRRQMGALPRGHSAHADTRGLSGEKVQTIGMGGKGTKLPHNPNFGAGKGTSLSQFKPNKAAAREAALAGDPLGGDPLTVKMDISKKATLQVSGKDLQGFNRSQLLGMKNDLKRLLRAVEKLTKSSPELDDKAKRGASAGGASDPGEESLEREEDKARWRFIDRTPYEQVHGVMKR